jgi:diguanylate cyclase (GGDEF)-like protein/PAS domain S-box-containing protein
MLHTSDSSHLLVNANSVRADTLGDVSRGHLALSEDPALLGALLSASPLGIACITQNGELLYGNEKLSEIFGQELDSDNVFAVLTDATLGQELIIQDAFDAVSKTGQWFGNLRIERPDGSFCNVRNWVTSAAQASGNYVSIFEDLTSLDVASAQTDHLRSLLEESDALALVFDDKGTIQYANPTARRRLGLEGLTETELSLLNYLEVLRLTPESFELMIAEVIPALLNSGQWSGETSFVDLQEFIVQTVTDAHRNIGKNGQTFYTITVHDVTQLKNIAEKLRSQEIWFRTIVAQSADAVFVVRRSEGIIYASPRAEELLGIPLEEIIGTKLRQKIHPDDIEGLPHGSPSGPAIKRPYVDHPIRVLNADGNYRFCEGTAVNFDVDKSNSVAMITIRDVTDRRRSETLLREQAGFLRLVASSAPISNVLAALCDLVEETFVGAKAAVMRVSDGRLSFAGGPRMPDEFVDAMQSVPLGVEGGLCGIAVEAGEPVYSFDVANDLRLAGCRDLLLRNGFKSVWSIPVSSSDEDAIIASIAVFWHELHEVTTEEVAFMATLCSLCSIAVDRKEYETRLSHQAHHDALTGLPNRSLFTELLSIATARASRGNTVNAVMFIDLDRFKEVNDSLGHDAGDELLINVASRLRECSRASDTIARFGGDEFVVLCQDLDPENASGVIAELAERLLASIDQPMMIKGQSLRVSASVGVSISGGNAKAAGMLRDADAAMYKAKKNGKARVEVFGDELRSSALNRLEMESGLRSASMNGELVLEYQPVINLVTGSVEGVEALVRWLHPTQGMLQPASFIEIAEETGAISEVGNFVIREACSQLGRWIMDGDVSPNFTVSVNVSARQFEGSDLIEVVSQALALSGLTPSQLVLEITEGTLMEPASIDALRELHDLGVQVAIDDFGTGYSSLYYLKRFPVDIVKIDRSFVDGLGHDPDDEAIVSAVLGLGHALGLLVVAEGVENETQMQALSALGCDSAQGFLISRPLPASAIPALATP